MAKSQETKEKAVKKVVESHGLPVTENGVKELVKHIDTHMYFLGERIPFKFTWNDALFSWYDNIFTVIMLYMDNKVLHWLFPEFSAEQLFFELSKEWYMVSVNAQYNEKNEPYVDEAIDQLIERSSKNKLFKVLAKLFIR